jgi:leader peptidase (prepilin peptidase)/N-methyltransferase
MGDVFMHDAYVSVTGRWAFVLLAFALGGTLGSFMNVVVYRLPRRMSLSWPGSHCPSCGKAIRWHDNVPILGWLWLKGRCRDCRAPISPRYPLVEALVAAISASLAWVDLFVPLASPDLELANAYGLSVGPYAFHLGLMCTLVTAALIEYDRNRPPARMFTLAMAIGLAAGGMWPQLRWDAPLGETHLGGVFAGVLGGLASLVVAALGWPAWIGRAEKPRGSAAALAAAELAMVGVFLATREMAIAGATAMALYAASMALGRAWTGATRFGWAGCLAIATLVTIVALRSCLWLESRIIEYDALATFVVAGIVVATAALVSRLIATPGGTQP